MSFSYIPFQDLMEFFHISETSLKEKTYTELEQMTETMRHQKAMNEHTKNASDIEYARIIRKYFTPYKFLRKWWSDEEIILACSNHASLRDIVSEKPVRKGQKCMHTDAEYITTKTDSLPRYTKSGEQLLESEITTCDIYRIKHTYQGLCHGKIILELLYSKYPQLMPFNFQAYEYTDYGNPYEIYPKNHIYTPVQALMEKDIDAIINRNINYANSYNASIHTPEETKKRLKSDDAKHYFEIIRNL